MIIHYHAGWRFRLCLLSLLAMGSSAMAQVSGMILSPIHFTPWNWEMRPLSGPVESYDRGSEVAAAVLGAPPKRELQVVHHFRRGDDGTLVETIGDQQHKITYDQSGRRVRVESHYNGSSREVQVATYKEDGTLVALSSERSDGQKIVATVATTDKGNGTRERVIEYKDETGDPVVCRYLFNAHQQLVLYDRVSGKRDWGAVKLQYNQHGDVETVSCPGSPDERYDGYEYDQQGNWIRRTWATADRKTVEYRAIRYAAQGPATSATRPSPDGGEANLPGSYRRELGKDGDAVHAVMTLTLSADHTLRFTAVNTFRNETTRKAASGTWTFGRGVLLVRLEKADDGRAIPNDQRTIRLRPALPDAKKLSMMADDDNGEFVRIEK